jgi:hypothetical protein
MYGIPLIDVSRVCRRTARSALPDAPVIEDERKRTARSGRKRLAVTSRAAR